MENTDKITAKMGAVIRGRRDSCGLSQEKLAELADLSLSLIQKIEQGKRWPGKKAMDALASALGCSILDFFSDLSKNEDPQDRRRAKRIANLPVKGMAKPAFLEKKWNEAKSQVFVLERKLEAIKDQNEALKVIIYQDEQDKVAEEYQSLLDRLKVATKEEITMIKRLLGIEIPEGKT